MDNCRRGFTLVETIFSTLFISLTVLAIINLFPGAYLSVQKSRTLLQADMLATSILEELRAKPFAELTSGPYVRAEDPFQIQKIDNVVYSPKVILFDVDDTDPSVVRGVRVEIAYRVKNSGHTTVHETYLHSLVR